MKKLILLASAFCAFAGYGAYQYIISGYPAANPSESASSSAVAVNANTSASAADAAALETRVYTASTRDFEGDVFRRTKPGLFLFVR